MFVFVSTRSLHKTCFRYQVHPECSAQHQLPDHLFCNWGFNGSSFCHHPKLRETRQKEADIGVMSVPTERRAPGGFFKSQTVLKARSLGGWGKKSLPSEYQAGKTAKFIKQRKRQKEGS